MKRLFSILILAAMVSGCSKDDAAQPATFTLTGYSDINTRTAFGTPDTERIPFVWSVDDKIWVDGGQPSSPLETGGVPTATFTFTSEPQEGATIYYNMKGLSAIANIPAEQDANNSLGLNGDFGYATVENGSFTLNHATAYLWFDVTRANGEGELEGATLESITIDASDATIAGTAQWNGSAFNTPTNGKSTITLTVGKELATANEGVMAAAVVLPTTLSKLTLTYEFTVGDKTKYYDKTIEKSRVLESGHTYRIAVEGLKASNLYSEPELRVLTFEDGTQKFSPYSFWTYKYDGSESFDKYEMYTISKWSELIPDTQHGDPMHYGVGDDIMGIWADALKTDYYWCDSGNTMLKHVLPSGSYRGGGHVISNYVREDFETCPDEGWWAAVQLSTLCGGNNGSSNFCVHNGYSATDHSDLPGFEFSDGKARVIDHMYVTNTTYATNCLILGDGFTGPIVDDSWFKIVATGYDENDNEVAEKAECYLCDVAKGIFADDWVQFDLSSLGKVKKVVFNMYSSTDLHNGYGMAAPAYFAYDDVAVWFE
jgi:hypothetical protein